MILMTWILDFLRDMNIPHYKSFCYSRAHDAWLSVIAIKTGKQHQISLELEKQDFWQVPAAAATAAAAIATSAARLRLVLTSCRQGRLTGLGLLTLQKRWSTKLQSHLKTVTMSKRLVKSTYNMNYIKISEDRVKSRETSCNVVFLKQE